MISIDPLCEDDNAQFTTVPLKHLSNLKVFSKSIILICFPAVHMHKTACKRYTIHTRSDKAFKGPMKILHCHSFMKGNVYYAHSPFKVS